MTSYLFGLRLDEPIGLETRGEAAGWAYWCLWTKRLPPYGQLAKGDHVFVVDNYRSSRTVRWGYEVEIPCSEPYGSLREAAAIIIDRVNDQLTEDGILDHPYTREKPESGYLVSWRGRPIVDWNRELPPPSEFRLGRNGWTEVTDQQLRDLGLTAD